MVVGLLGGSGLTLGASHRGGLPSLHSEAEAVTSQYRLAREFDPPH
jgi:hypothetical protein